MAHRYVTLKKPLVVPESEHVKAKWVGFYSSKFWSRDPAHLVQAAESTSLEIYGLNYPDFVQIEGLLMLVRSMGFYYTFFKGSDFGDEDYMSRIELPTNVVDILKVAELGELSRHRPPHAILKKVNTPASATPVIKPALVCCTDKQNPGIAQGVSSVPDSQQLGKQPNKKIALPDALRSLAQPLMFLATKDRSTYAAISTENVVLWNNSANEFIYVDPLWYSEGFWHLVDKLRERARNDGQDFSAGQVDDKLFNIFNPATPSQKLAESSRKQMKSAAPTEFVPHEWPRPLLRRQIQERQFCPKHYGLRRVKVALTDESGENHVLRDSHGKHYLWNRANEDLHLIIEPKGRDTVLKVLHQPSIVVTKSVRKRLNADLAKELGIESGAGLVPSEWLDKHPYKERVLQDFPFEFYGMSEILPVLLSKDLSMLLVHWKDNYYIWVIHTLHLHRVTRSKDLLSILASLGREGHFDRGDHTAGLPSLLRSLHLKEELLISPVSEAIPEENIPIGWVHAKALPTFPTKRALTSPVEVFLRKEDGSMYLFAAWFIPRTGPDFYIWERETQMASRIDNPKGLFNILQDINDLDLLDLDERQHL